MTAREPKIYSVSEFVGVVRNVLTEKIGETIIQGEVIDFKIIQNKFIWFDLKDKTSVVSCFMMKWDLKVSVEDGMEIKILGVPQLFQKSGRFHIRVSAIELLGEGALQKAYEELKQKLLKEGLFDKEHKQPLPQFPEKIGIISSADAAAYTDVLRNLKDRWSGLSIYLYPVQVQGFGSVKKIVEAFAYFNQQPIVDVLILTRGGGSLEDLQAFNSEEVARAVFGSKIPVICAVGHERDESLADYAADQRAPTPSMAAQIVVPDKHEALNTVNRLIKSVYTDFNRAIDDQKEELHSNLNQIIGRIEERVKGGLAKVQSNLNRVAGRLEERVIQGQMKILSIVTSLNSSFVSTLGETRLFIDAFVRLLDNINPKNVLHRGYTLSWNADKKLITDPKDVAIGEQLVTQFAKGSIISKVKSKS